MTNAINPTEGRVYGGASNLIHLADGTREEVGRMLATHLDTMMRFRAVQGGARTQDQAYGDAGRRIRRQQLCPGCYMVASVAAAVALAERNGQSVQELGNSLSAAFDAIAKNGTGERNMEWIDVQLDSPPMPQQQQQSYEEGDALVQMARAGLVLFPGTPL